MTIIGDILLALQNKDLKFTHLLYKSNLSHSRLKEYLEELIGRGLVLEKDTKEGKRFHLTDDGARFLQEYRRVNEFVKSFGL